MDTMVRCFSGDWILSSNGARRAISGTVRIDQSTRVQGSGRIESGFDGAQ